MTCIRERERERERSCLTGTTDLEVVHPSAKRWEAGFLPGYDSGVRFLSIVWCGLCRGLMDLWPVFENEVFTSMAAASLSS
jgi:hypothetical protein